jgi:hypothetical protein
VPDPLSGIQKKGVTVKQALLLGLVLTVAAISTPLSYAADTTTEKPAKKKSKLTEEQQKVRKEMVDKYDANKNGKLDKSEREKISKEDLEKMNQAGLGPKGKKATGKKGAPTQTP